MVFFLRFKDTNKLNSNEKTQGLYENDFAVDLLLKDKKESIQQIFWGGLPVLIQ